MTHKLKTIVLTALLGCDTENERPDGLDTRVKVYDGSDVELGFLWSFSDVYVVWQPSTDLVFQISPESGQVKGFWKDSGYTRFNSDCSEHSEFMEVELAACSGSDVPPTPARLWSHNPPDFAVETEYLTVPSWRLDWSDGSCYESIPRCVARMQSVSFEAEFPTPIQIY